MRETGLLRHPLFPQYVTFTKVESNTLRIVKRGHEDEGI